MIEGESVSAEAVAARLTKAQRRAVMGRRSLQGGGGVWPLVNSLRSMNLVEGLTPSWTQLALEVPAPSFSSKPKLRGK